MSTRPASLANIFGMDFGTTNSGVSVWNYDTQKVDVLSLDPKQANAKVVRTAIYITNDQNVHIGQEAVTRYTDQNTGRPVRMEKVWVGEIEVRAEGVYYVTDVYVLADVLSPGRLFLSIKSGLREPDFLGTVVGQHYYPLEDIIALYLTVTKTRAEQVLANQGHTIDGIEEIVLGRPVRFAFDAEKDALAQRRLLDAALRAGYKRIHFQYEPVAAAYDYARTVSSPENVLVFDFGGGTLDITVMHIDGKGGHQILSTGGIPVAGDTFDQKVTRTKLPKHFGEGSHYTTDHKNMPIPGWIYDIFSNWQRILELQAPENMAIINEIARTAHRPREIQALQTLVGDNYGLQMFRAVEEAKRRLSDDMGTLIHFNGPNFNIRQMLTRTEFEAIIGEEVRAIRAHLDEMLTQAGLSADQIDSVVRTGGSAEIPVFRHMLYEKFGADKVRQIDTFSSVTAGLGICAAHVAEGRLDLRTWTAEDLEAHSTEKEADISPVNLKLLKKRIYLQEGVIDPAEVPAQVSLFLTGKNQIYLNVDQPLEHGEEPHTIDWDATPRWIQSLTAGFDQQILCMTNLYRFLLLTPRTLSELFDLNMTVQDLHHFRPFEEITAFARWDDIKGREFMVFVTSRGFARAIKLDQIEEKIESPNPYKFDHSPAGVPVTVSGANSQDDLIVFNNQGRLLRYPCRDNRIRYRGVQAINWKDGERVLGGLVYSQDRTGEILVTVTQTGYGKRINPADIVRADKHNTRPPMVITRKPIIGVQWADEASRLLTTKRFVQVDTEGLAPPDGSTKSEKLLKVAKDEVVLAIG